ncbi:MAG: tetratricopeptide repeat protein, partial [Acidobacteriaceae bacterium]|nr:tetratricopeptide repeat protein [Acidobacteriaceae bacterium]
MALRTAAVFLVVTFGVCRPAASFQDDRITALKRAAALIEGNDLGPAETALQRVLAESPEDAVALNLLGLIRARQEKSAEAERLFRRAIATGQGIVGPHLNLARLYASDRPLDALRELRTVLSRAPSDEQASTLLRSIAKNGAGDALRSNRKDDALVLVRLAREIQPKDPEVLYLYGMVAFQEQLYSDAQLALEQALQLRPHFSEARYALSRVYLNENRAQAAEQEMR